MGFIKKTYHIFIFLFFSFIAVSIFFGGDILRQAGETIGTGLFESLADKADSIKYRVDTAVGKIDKVQQDREKKGAEMARKLKDYKKDNEDILKGKD
ncbi:MAG: hypothetical protein NT178_05150 [Proteobacteria bacterium]|nr:hypothetical protein [Pseudomonadota bacterium]